MDNKDLIKQLEEIAKEIEERKDGYIPENNDGYSFRDGLDKAKDIINWKIHLLKQ